MRRGVGCVSRLPSRAASVAVACWCGAAGLAIATAADKPAEKLVVKRLLPAGSAAGATVVVKAEGTFPRWPVRIWTDRGGTTWIPREEKGTFTVTSTADGFGVHRVRIHDEREAATIHRFVVGTVPETMEAEPNDRPQEPQAVSTLPITVNGVLEKAGDVDGYGVQLEAGQTLVAAVDAHVDLSTPLDAVLEIVDDRGGYLARNLDARGLDPRIVFRAARTGRHVVRIYGFPADPNQTIGYTGGVEHVYRLTLSTGGYVVTTMPAAVSRSGTTAVRASGWNLPATVAAVPLAASREADSIWAAFPGTAGVVRLPVVPAERLPLAAPEATIAVQPPLVASGLFTAADQPLVVRIKAAKSQPLLVAVEANRIGSEAEAVFAIQGADGRSLMSKSDRDPPAAWTPPADGDYSIMIRERRGAFGPAHMFRLSVVASAPDLAAASATDAITGRVGGMLDLVIDVERLRGWKEPVEFVLVEPPAGITADPVVSAIDGVSAKQVTLKIKAAAALSGPLAVEARRPGKAATSVAAVRFGKDKMPVVWLTVAP